MTAVDLWKARQPLSRHQRSANHWKWRTVGIGENAGAAAAVRKELKFLAPRSTDFPHLLQHEFTGSRRAIQKLVGRLQTNLIERAYSARDYLELAGAHKLGRADKMRGMPSKCC